MFKRKIYQQLKDWKEKYKGTYSVLIQGARRVGKSTVAEEFTKNEYRSYIKIDFANISEDMSDVMKSITDLDLFFLRLQAEKYSMHVDRPWLISQLDLNKEGSILFYPIYCLPFLLSEEHMSSAQ